MSPPVTKAIDAISASRVQLTSVVTAAIGTLCCKVFRSGVLCSTPARTNEQRRWHGKDLMSMMTGSGESACTTDANAQLEARREK